MNETMNQRRLTDFPSAKQVSDESTPPVCEPNLETNQARKRSNRLLRFAAPLSLLTFFAALLLILPATAQSPSITETEALAAVPTLVLETFAISLTQPVGIVSAGDERLFVVEKPGRIRILDSGGTIQEPPFLDIRDLVRSDDQEQGLLGLVFEPNDVTTFYIYYIARSVQFGEGVITLARYRTMAGNDNLADPNSAEILLTQPKPFTNHNAGDMAFGPDGNLYVAIGDGGGGGDPDELAQDLSKYFGKILRINVTGVATYTIPGGNPFAMDDDPNTLPEIWAYGMRNPWRMTFDRVTDDIFFGDVGEGDWEEVNRIPYTSTGGLNFGWDCYEGNEVYETDGCGPVESFVPPLYAYPHEGMCTSVTGGYVYRGANYPNLNGHYLFADFCFNQMYSLVPNGNGDWDPVTHTVSINQPSAFGQDPAGELYIAAVFDGIVYKIKDTSTQPTPDPGATATATKTALPSPTSTANVTPTATSTPGPATPTPTVSVTVSATVSPTGSPTALVTVTQTPVTPTRTPVPTGEEYRLYLPALRR